MIACLTPSDFNFEENLQTLNYAMKTNNIRNKPHKNLDPNILALEKLKMKNIKLDMSRKLVRKPKYEQ